MNPNLTQNLKSITRIAETVTTGATGNIDLSYQNTGFTFIVAPHAAGENIYLRAWVAKANNHWYLTAIDPNSGNTVNNATFGVRYLVVTLYER